MNAHYRLKTVTTLLLVGLIAASCAAGRGAYNRGNRAELSRDYEAAMEQYRIALQENPGNIEYRLKFEQTRFAAAYEHFEQGRRALERNDLETARREFTRAIEIDPTHEFAAQELTRLNERLANPAQNQSEPIPSFEERQELARNDPSTQVQLEPTLTGQISQVRMMQQSRTAFETLAEMAGLNVIFDPDFRDTPVSITLDNVDIYEALDVLSLQTRSFWQPINRNTILVSQDNQTKRREYEQHVLKTIYLSNSISATEITEAITALRTLLNMRYIAQSTTMNAIIVRDTADRIAIAEKILQDIDKSKPEVVVEATVLEVDRNQLRDLGILPPSSTSLIFNPSGQTPDDEDASNAVNLRDLNNINSGNFAVTIPGAVAKFLATSGRTKLLQNPRVRATDGKLASIHIGSRVPVPSGSFQPAFAGATGTPVVQFQYVDVGVNLDITPKVLLNREISMVVMVQVSALAGDRNIGGVTLPVFTNRLVTHEIRLSEGETNILGGIILDTESVSTTGIPGLKDVPILKYLFSQESTSREETEIIVMLTPHIVRMPDIRDINLRGLNIGTEVNTRLRPTPAAPGGTADAADTATPAAPVLVPLTPVIPAPPADAPAPVPQALSNATLSFAPSPAEVGPQGLTPVNVVIDGTNIFGVDLTLAFDPQSLAIRQVSEGGLLSRDGQIVAVVQRIETDTGLARISLERPPGVAGISGNGAIVTLMIEAGARKGETALRVIDMQVRDARQNVQAGRPTEVRVTVR